MRGGTGVKMGVPTNGRAHAQGDHRPSKLEMLREDYHRKILKEKEEKMMQLYEDSQLSQKKTMMRMMRTGSGEGSGGLGPAHGNTPNTGPSVREIFNERRRMEASGLPVPPIDDHFRQTKGYSSPGGWSSRTGSGNSAKKCSAGRDRSQPLTPIRRPGDTRDMGPRTGNTPRLEQRHGVGGGGSPGYNNDVSNPFNARPKLVKHKPLPPTNGHGHHGGISNGTHPQDVVDRNNNDKQQNQTGAGSSKFGYQGLHQNKYHQQQRQQQHSQPQRQQQQHFNDQLPPQHTTPKQQQKPGVNGKFRSNAMQRETPKAKPNHQPKPKMTDFQKWQMEQNKAREERLKKLNKHHSDFDEDQGRWAEEEDDHGDDESEEGEDHDDGDDDVDDEAERLERELMQKINREKAELDRLRRERVAAEEEEKIELEERKKQEKLDRAKQKKQEELRRKEEEQRRREEEEDERRERQREERERKEDEKRERKEEEKRRREEEKRRKEEEKLAAKRQKEEQKQQLKLQKQAKESSRSDRSYDRYDEETPINSARRSSPPAAPATMQEVDDRPVANADASFYAKVARSNEAKGSVGALASCKVCGRSFAVDRLKKHMDACKKANKPRKEFDSSKKRVEGTEAAKYRGRSSREPPKKKNNWRANHEEFINSLRYAKKVAQYEKEGKDLRQLTPPPAKEDPNLVPCPYCNRTFNSTAAERHIPRCKDLKTKPPPMNTRRR